MIQEGVGRMKYWSMWSVALARWHRLVDATVLIHGHLTYVKETLQVIIIECLNKLIIISIITGCPNVTSEAVPIVSTTEQISNERNGMHNV